MKDPRVCMSENRFVGETLDLPGRRLAWDAEIGVDFIYHKFLIAGASPWEARVLADAVHIRGPVDDFAGALAEAKPDLDCCRERIRQAEREARD